MIYVIGPLHLVKISCLAILHWQLFISLATFFSETLLRHLILESGLAQNEHFWGFFHGAPIGHLFFS